MAVFKEHWEQLQGRTPVTLVTLNEAGSRAIELLAAVGLKDQSAAVAGDAAQRRQKAYTLFVRAYDDARRALRYLRAEEEDADEIAPSLYAGRGGRGRNASSTEPAAADATPSKSGSSAPAPGPIHIDNSAGLPIDSPFTSN